MTTRTITLTGAGRTVQLVSATGVRAQKGLSGTGLPEVQVQWLEGAGDGALYRGARVMPRELDIPVTVEAATEDALLVALEDLEVILAPENAPARLTVARTVPGDPDPVVESWWVDVVRTGPLDWGWGRYASTKIRTTLRLTAGDPAWTRSAAVEIDPVTPGTVSTANPGTAPSWPTWEITGPATGFTLTSPTGAVLSWAGSLTSGQVITVDTRAGTVKRGTTNEYAGLTEAPRFWQIPAGTTNCMVAVTGSGTGTNVALAFYPRRRLMA